VSDNQTEFSDLKVMVIDDSKTIRRSAETLLKKAGCEVLTAENGFEALPIISEQHPDILFIDIMMPRLDGYQTCSLVKSNPKFSGIAIVMLSSKDGLFDRAKGRVVGAEEYLTKPFTREDLLGAIRTHLPAKESEPESQPPTPEVKSEPLSLEAEVEAEPSTPETETESLSLKPEPESQPSETESEPLSLEVESEPLSLDSK
jgi:twitching motility two-component system response regulator PilG